MTDRREDPRRPGDQVVDDWDVLLARSRWYRVGSPNWLVETFRAAPSALDAHPVSVGSYPDGELRLGLPVPPMPVSVVAGRVDDERTHRIRLGRLCMVHAACLATRQHGAARVVAVLPEIPYLRQDRPTPGTVELAARDWVAALLDVPVLDAVVTWQPKPELAGLLRRTALVAPTLDDVARAVLAALPDGGAEIDTVVAPDLGAARLAAAVAHRAVCGCHQLTKERLDTEQVRIADGPPPRSGHRCLIVDDMYVSGGTLSTAVDVMTAHGATVSCYVGNFRPTAVGRRRLADLLDSGRVQRLLVPRHCLVDGHDRRLTGVDTSTAMRAAVLRAVRPESLPAPDGDDQLGD